MSTASKNIMPASTKSRLLSASGEVRNAIYESIVSGIPEDATWPEMLNIIQGLICANKQLRTEALSYFLAHGKINATSIVQLDRIDNLMQPGNPYGLAWTLVTKMGLPNFAETTLTPTRALHLMNVCLSATNLQELDLNFRLEHMSIKRYLNVSASNQQSLVEAFATEHSLDCLHLFPNLKKVKATSTYHDYEDEDECLAGAPLSTMIVLDLDEWVTMELGRGLRVKRVDQVCVKVPKYAFHAFAWEILRT